MLHGPATLTLPDGTVHHAIFVNGILDGAASTTKDGVVEKYTYVKGKKEGPVRWNYPNGNIKVGEYWKGKLQGTVRVTSPDGSTQSWVYVDGKSTGMSRITMPNKESRYVRTGRILI